MTSVPGARTLLIVRLSTTFEVSIPPDRVAAYLADPRHLLMANHAGPVVEQSQGPLAAGSWYVLAFDQLRARVEYTAFDPPRLIAVRLAMSGRGSGGMRSAQEFELSAIDDGRGPGISSSTLPRTNPA